ncbi:MAG: methyltransferase domain-containing protein [Bacteroidetes bacterium]|nr:methyltransferase domain-containing protein [Bacteroidota bacterium]
MPFFTKDNKTALEAIEQAQWIAFAPIVFQASRALRDLGILEIVMESKTHGVSLEEVVQKTGLSEYGVRVLLEAGLGIGLVVKNDNLYTITKTGLFILNDAMTKANMDFTQDVCYEGMFGLDKSIQTGKPTGLKVFGEWPTVYEALAHLPPKVQQSWFTFDHYYSDRSFAPALVELFKRKPKHILDIGGNTGKFTLKCMAFDADVRITILDLPGQLAMAKSNIAKTEYGSRVDYFPINILDDAQQFPKGADAIWMSQFLDCFSENEIVSILKRCHTALATDGRVYIMETFWDRQKFETAAFSLQMTSLYFTNIANGNSQMYNSEVFNRLIDKAGFVIEEQIDNIGISHTVQVCRKK